MSKRPSTTDRDPSVTESGDDDTFLSRWARRKRAVRTGADPDVEDSHALEEQEKALAEVEKAFITTPEKAAKEILAGIGKRRPRILVGPDARMIEWLERLLPVRNVSMLGRLLGWKNESALKARQRAKSRATRAPVAPPIRATELPN